MTSCSMVSSQRIGGTMWRDLGFRGFDTVYLVRPVSGDIIARLQDAAVVVMRREGMGRREILDHPPLALPEGASDVDLISASRLGRIPFQIAVSGDQIAVHLPHELADGVEGTRLVAALLQEAAGETSDTPEPGLRLPLLRALSASGLSAVRSYLTGRDERRALPDPGAAGSPVAGAFDRVTLDATGIAQLRRTTSSGGRATLMTRAASVALAALGAIAPESVDARVVLPTDLRPLIGGRRVSGNFVSAEAYGTLRGTEWTPAAINRFLAARRSTGAVALAAAILRRTSSRGMKSTVDRRATISVSLMGTIGLPDLAGDGLELACATAGSAAGTFMFIAQVGEVLTVSLWDDTGMFDVSAFPDAFVAEIRRRSR